jgi:stage II sporulation protein D
MSGTTARSIFELKSCNFSFKIDGDNICFSVIGYGHGVGLSQCGSDSLAKKGYSYEEIINYYFKNVEISE